MKEQIKALVREKLATKKIILWGKNKAAEDFYQEYKSLLHFSYCISANKKECGIGAFCGELDVREFKKAELQEDEYIIVCDPFAFRAVELQLQAEGFEMYQHFVESQIASAIFSHKKIALFYGNCVLRDIYQCIVHISAFVKEYAIVFIQIEVEQAVVMNRLLYYMKDICDLYVYTPKVLDGDSAYFISREQLPEDCRSISVSNLVWMAYWPQAETDNAIWNQWYLHSYNVSRSLTFYHTLYRYDDFVINKMVAERMKTDEIVRSVSADNFYSEKEVKRNKVYSMKIIEMAERGVDVTVADFINEKHQQVMLYQNYMHPNANVIWEYIRRLLRLISVSEQETYALEMQSAKHIHHGGDIPIYPSVARHLGLQFVDDTTEYEIMIGSGIRNMTFKEYVEHYVEYIRKTMEIIQMW